MLSFTKVKWIRRYRDSIPRRVFGPRKVRFPFALLGYGTMICSVGLAAYYVETVPRQNPWVELFVFTSFQAIGIHFLNIAIRAESQSIRDVTAKDQRGAVFYLRPFAQEQLPFIRNLYTHGQYKPVPALVAIVHWFKYLVPVTFEEFFHTETSKAIGPFVALGNPTDYIPPVGATRVYEDDKRWFETFKGLSQQAACFLIEPNGSLNFRLELRSILTDGLQHKLFIITPPGDEPSTSRTRKQLESAKKLAAEREERWKAFHQLLNEDGYNLTITEPLPGSVIGFDADRNSILLTIGACTPSEYISSILSKLGTIPSAQNDRRESGNELPLPSTSAQIVEPFPPNHLLINLLNYIGEAWNIFWRHPVIFSTLAFVYFLSTIPDIFPSFSSEIDAVTPIHIVIGVLCAGLLANGVWNDLAGSPITLSTFGADIKTLFRLTLLGLLQAVAVGLFTAWKPDSFVKVAVTIPLVYAAIECSFAYLFIIDRRIGIETSLRYCYSISKGQWVGLASLYCASCIALLVLHPYVMLSWAPPNFSHLESLAVQLIYGGLIYAPIAALTFCVWAVAYARYCGVASITGIASNKQHRYKTEETLHRKKVRWARLATLAMAIILTFVTGILALHDWARTQKLQSMNLLLQGQEVLSTDREQSRHLFAKAVAASRAALTVYSHKSQSENWSATQQLLGLALRGQALASYGDEAISIWRETAELYRGLINFAPNSSTYYEEAYWIYQEELFAFSDALELTERWLEKHQNDLFAQVNFAEASLTMGRISDAEQRLKALLVSDRMEGELAIRASALHIVSQIILDKREAAGEMIVKLRQRIAGQREDFHLSWYHLGLSHFIVEKYAEQHQRLLLLILDALSEIDRRTILEALEKVQHARVSAPYLSDDSTGTQR